MNRRELLTMIAAATGTAFIGGTALLAGCTRPADVDQKLRFDAADIALLDEVAETIIPRTDTPGAKDAEVGQFMTVMVNDCYSAEEQAIFHRGMAQLRATSLESYQRAFMNLDPEQRHRLISRLDREARLHNAGHAEPHYFTLMKQLTLFGFFTSKAGATQVLRFIAIPGRYEDCIPYNKGDRAWAT